MEKKEFLQWLELRDFQSIFQDLGWNSPMQACPFEVTLPSNGRIYEFKEIAQLGVRVFVCETTHLPLAAERSALDARLRKVSEATYITIFVKGDEPFHHLWMVPIKNIDKRTLVTIEYTSHNQADFLYTKLADFTFPIGEVPNILDVVDSVNRAFAVNAAKVTKTFYQEFRKKHSIFEKAIKNITDSYDREWYASVMLNRLMFCYFIQKKGFLDLDKHYLKNKLNQTQAERGKGKFYGSFYRDFLRILFVDGLNARQQTEVFKKRFGKIPYLNGGMFEEHILEQRYPKIDIPDEVFEKLFVFFDEWNWHLDTSITASGKDINPDVLGYIFEQYINDRAQMGAYYTKEDITEYIARNTILPWLFNETAKKSPAAFKPNGYVWTTLRQSGDACIFPTVRKGIDLPLPKEIEKGVDTTKANLRERRSEWNTPAAETHALPTEIWRETVARRLRCQELREKIVNGEIYEVNDLITYNLDVRKFAEMVLSQTDDHLLVRHFYDALCRVTILDPTCGSGAFLFAALNILEPLYEICLTRMQEDWPNKFEKELAELKDKYRNNLKYCIYKNIILRNLYGVDLMREATEIARLRLFLKMVAVVDVDEMEENLGLDPLPDIDFNIRCGNTLVGFVNPEDVKNAILPPDELAIDTEAYAKVEIAAADIADLYERFKTLQQTDEGSALYYAAKHELKSRLSILNDELDRAMAYRQYGISSSPKEKRQFEEWKRTTQAFHWYSEFYGIVVANGGFDVIIGNPPYVEYSKVKNYRIKGYKTESCGNLYAYVMERSFLLSKNRDVGMIVPTSSISTTRMKPLQDELVKSCLYHSTYGFRPAKLFDGGTSANIHLSILISNSRGNEIFALHHIKWNSEFRDYLFTTLPIYTCNTLNLCNSYNRIVRCSGVLQKGILKKVLNQTLLETYVIKEGSPVYFRNTGGLHYRVFTRFTTGSNTEEVICFENDTYADVVMCLLASNLWNILYYSFSCCLHITKSDLLSQPLDLIGMSAKIKQGFSILSLRLNKDIKKNAERTIRHYKAVGDVECYQINMKASKPIIDVVDELLAEHYGFTEEELDFIINYDIKFRMSDEE